MRQQLSALVGDAPAQEVLLSWLPNPPWLPIAHRIQGGEAQHHLSTAEPCPDYPLQGLAHGRCYLSTYCVPAAF